MDSLICSFGPACKWVCLPNTISILWFAYLVNSRYTPSVCRCSNYSGEKSEQRRCIHVHNKRPNVKLPHSQRHERCELNTVMSNMSPMFMKLRCRSTPIPTCLSIRQAKLSSTSLGIKLMHNKSAVFYTGFCIHSEGRHAIDIVRTYS
jgi:hypothetical protein